MSALERLADARDDAPAAAAAMVRLVLDNPGQFAVITAATIVATKTAFRIVQPRTALEALALLVVLELAIPKLAMTAIDRGWLTIRIRDAHGCLVPLVTGLTYEIGDDDPPRPSTA